MEFCKDRVFTALNADELRAGDKVIVADTIGGLEAMVSRCVEPVTLEKVMGKLDMCRFIVPSTKSGNISFPLAYLVEKAENCTNCGKTECSAHSEHDDFKVAVCSNWIPKAEPKTEQKAEKKYRPFRDTDDLQQVWGSRCNEGKGYILNSLDMPHIWIRQKECSKGGLLITYFGEDEVRTDMGFLTMSKLLSDYTFTDGSPCGVEE